MDEKKLEALRAGLKEYRRKVASGEIPDGLKEYRRKVASGEIIPRQRHNMKKMIRDKCKDCMCDYADGRVDCGIPKCSLYPLMPYRKRT